MAVQTLIRRTKRADVTPSLTTLVLTPIPGPTESVRIECTECPATLIVRGFAHPALLRLVAVVEAVHRCEKC